MMEKVEMMNSQPERSSRPAFRGYLVILLLVIGLDVGLRLVRGRSLVWLEILGLAESALLLHVWNRQQLRTRGLWLVTLGVLGLIYVAWRIFWPDAARPNSTADWIATTPLFLLFFAIPIVVIVFGVRMARSSYRIAFQELQ